MAVQLILKNSSVEDKRPGGSALASGEIALNYNQAGAFLCCTDSAGNVQQIGGVKIDENAPASPVKQTLWLKASTQILSIYDGSGWKEVLGASPAPVDSVNGQTGVVVLTAGDVGAATTAQGVKADSAIQPGDDVSELNNNAGYITATALTPYVEKAGDTMTGNLTLPGGGAAADALQKQEIETLITTLAPPGAVPGDGKLTIKTAGEGAGSTGTYTANQDGDSTITLPAIRYEDVSGTPDLTPYVEKAGDNMTGDLTLGPVGAPVISLDATKGFGSSIKQWRTSTTLGAAPGDTQEGAELQPFGRVFVSRTSAQNIFVGLQTNVDTMTSPSCYIGSRGDVYFKRNLRIEAGYTPPTTINPEYYYVETDSDTGATTNVSYPMMLGSLVGNYGDDSGSAIFANTVDGNPIKIHAGGIKRNKGRGTRQYGNYGAHYISEGSSNTDCRIALCRNNNGGAAGIHLGKTGNYNDGGLDLNTLYYPLTDESQSLGTVSSWFADDYQMVLGARIQSSLVGPVTPGTAVGSPGKAETSMTFDVMNSNGELALSGASTLTLRSDTLYVNTTNGLTLNQPDQSIVFAERGNSKLTYEDGNWSPTVQIGGTDLTPTTSAGFYTRVGRTVYVVGRVQGVTIGGNTGKLQIGNLPFQTSGNAVGNISDQGVGQVMLWNSTSGINIYGTPIMRTNKASLYLGVNFMKQTSLGTSSNNLATAQGEDFFATSNDQFRFACTYFCPS